MIGEVTAANIAMDEDKKEEQKKGHVDRSKLEAEIKALVEQAGQASPLPLDRTSYLCRGGRRRHAGKLVSSLLCVSELLQDKLAAELKVFPLCTPCRHTQ